MVLLSALLLDWAFGEPPSRWHPVAGIGCLIGVGRAAARWRSPAALVLQGALVVAGVSGVAVALALLAERALIALPPLLALAGEAWLLKCTFSLRRLFGAVELVRGHLVAGDLEGARRELGLHLVSRRTDELDAAAVASGAVESIAENFTDSWIGPACCFIVGQLGGLGAGRAAAWVYRVVNTADAMIGYREGDLLYLGRVAARLDDVLNFVPARLGAAIIVAAAALAGRSARDAWGALRGDARRTASPNAGQTMAAMAGAIGVRLEKRGHYELGSGPPADVGAIDAALGVMRWAVALSIGAALVALWLVDS
jgi:adenosylcobinamide-phosphate synthase